MPDPTGWTWPFTAGDIVTVRRASGEEHVAVVRGMPWSSQVALQLRQAVDIRGGETVTLIRQHDGHVRDDAVVSRILGNTIMVEI